MDTNMQIKRVGKFLKINDEIIAISDIRKIAIEAYPLVYTCDLTEEDIDHRVTIYSKPDNEELIALKCVTEDEAQEIFDDILASLEF